ENRVHTLEGTGLGLSIVKNIVEKHSSRVHLVSEVNVGTTFWFDLPVFQPEEPNAGRLTPDERESETTAQLMSAGSNADN
ncbi:MAG: ATP-binding protein, partial [Cyanobacteria bacterium P01_H01_bin.162]